MVFVRKAQLEDIENLTKLLLSNDITPGDIANDKGDYYVCVYDDVICGFGMLMANEDYCLVKNIFVSEEYRRKKVGSSIVKSMLNSAKIHGANFAICISQCNGFVKYLNFKPTVIDKLPKYFKNYIESQGIREHIYSASLHDYFKCCC